MKKGDRVAIIDWGILLETIDDENTLKKIDVPIDLDDPSIRYAFSGFLKPWPEEG